MRRQVCPVPDPVARLGRVGVGRLGDDGGLDGEEGSGEELVVEETGFGVGEVAPEGVGVGAEEGL